LPAPEGAVDHFERVDPALGRALGMAVVVVRRSVVVEYIVITIPKKRQMVGTPWMVADPSVVTPTQRTASGSAA
jgi:hypothetical protein